MSPEPWHEAVLASLAELRDATRQQQAWLETGAELYAFPSSPSELVCELFDDTGLAELLSTGAFGGKADALLRELDQLLREIDLARAPELLLADRSWQMAQRLAGVAHAEIELALGRNDEA